MTERGSVLELARAAETALDRNRARIDDLNVYPVPDGDTGTNMLLTVRAVREALEAGKTDVAHAALLGARGNSGVILSQIIRGAVEGFDEDGSVATALRRSSDSAWAAVREPAEGTILTVIRELADEAESRRDDELPELLHALVERGDEAVARTQEQLDVLRKAGVVDAGAAGLVEILRGISAYVSGEPLPEPVEAVPLSADAIHQEASRYRYCTVFVVEGEQLDRDVLERELEPLGDSLLVVGDATALKAHVHTDDPGSALRAGTAMGVIERVEIANMHLQSAQREERLSQPGSDDRRTAVVAVVTGEGNRRLFESMGATGIVDGGETMNPSTEELLEAIESDARARGRRAGEQRQRRPRRAPGGAARERARSRRPVELPAGGPRSDARVRPACGCGRRTQGRWKTRPRRSRQVASRLRRERSASMGCKSSAAPTSASSAATPSRAGRASTPSPPRSSTACSPSRATSSP